MESIEFRQDMPGFYLIAGNLSLEILKVVILSVSEEKSLATVFIYSVFVVFCECKT